MKHSFKPRYKICFQTRNKVWIYKNSRLRNFYKIRHKIVLKTGRFAKRYLITKNMKWTVARRQMVPYFRNRNRFSYFYKNLFFTKQQLKNFYGGLKEYEIRNIFKKTWNKSNTFRCNSFLGALEQRLSMILFRMRFLPTIFSCHQFIKHKGIFVNNSLITKPNYLIQIGDFVSIGNNQWFLFYKFLYERLENRFFGQGLLLWRKNFLLRKILFLRYKNKKKYIQNFKLYKILYNLKLKFRYIRQHIYIIYKILNKKKIFFYNVNKKKKKKNFKFILFRLNWKINSLKILNQSFYLNIFFKFKKIIKNIFFLKKWNSSKYILKVNKIIFNMYNIKNLLINFTYLFSKLLISWIIYDFKKSLNIKNFSEKKRKKKLIFLINAWQKVLENKKLLIKKKNINQYCFKRLKMHIEARFKKTLYFKIYSIKNKRFLNYKLRKLKFKRSKKKLFKHWCKKSHLYIPNYLEMDFNTLRISFIKYPEINEVFYSFINTFKKIISFYKERAL